MKVYVDCFYYGFYIEEEELVKYSINKNNINNYNYYLSEKYNSEYFNKIKNFTHIPIEIDKIQIQEDMINVKTICKNNENNKYIYNFTNLLRLIPDITFLTGNYF
tara:strand:+ start:217 stop:531 length:315 start_codon:yes stop_codon:yes gene_type:complete